MRERPQPPQRTYRTTHFYLIRPIFVKLETIPEGILKIMYQHTISVFEISKIGWEKYKFKNVYFFLNINSNFIREKINFWNWSLFGTFSTDTTLWKCVVISITTLPGRFLLELFLEVLPTFLFDPRKRSF